MSTVEYADAKAHFPYCPFCGGDKISMRLTQGGDKDLLWCEECKARRYLYFGIRGLSWAKLERAHLGLGEMRSFRRTVSAIMLSLLLVGMLTLAFNIKPARAEETIFIRADGSIDPPTSPVSSVDDVTFTFTGNISSNGDGIVVERDNIVVDGAGYTLQGAGVQYSEGIDLGGRNNVTIENTNIKNFWYGIVVLYSSHNRIVGNNITNNEWDAIALSAGSSNNTISGNNITNNYRGVSVFNSSNNTVCHNNFIDNAEQASYEFGSNVWDNGYPSGGNYWSDYNGTDLYYGSYQNETGSDGIGDTPYTIDEKNQDRYPFVEIIPEFSSLLVLPSAMLLTALLLILAKKKYRKNLGCRFSARGWG